MDRYKDRKKYMYCTNCGKEIPDDSKFCLFCGTATNEEKHALSSAKRMQKRKFLYVPLIVISLVVLIGAGFLGFHVLENHAKGMQRDMTLVASDTDVSVDDTDTVIEPYDEAYIAYVIAAANEDLKTMGYGNVRINELWQKTTDSGDLTGAVISATSMDGFGGEIGICVEINMDGIIEELSFLTIGETSGLGSNATSEDFKGQFVGKKADPLLVIKDGTPVDNEISAISGATITSNAVTNAVNAAIYAFHVYAESPESISHYQTVPTSASENSEDEIPSNKSLINKDYFIPSQPSEWADIIAGRSNTKIYNESDGEWVQSGGYEKFMIDGIYITSAYVKQDDFTYYWVSRSGHKGPDGCPMEQMPSGALINFYPGTTTVRDLDYDDMQRSALYPAILYSIYMEHFPDDFKINPQGEWENGGLFYDYTFNTNAIGYVLVRINNYKKRSDFRIQLEMKALGDGFNEREEFMKELLEPIADPQSIQKVMDMFDYKSKNRQDYGIKGYYSDLKIAYIPYPSGNKIIVENY